MADSNARPIFVTLETTAFSGATLLAMLMNAHPDISSIGEIRGLIDSVDPATYLCSCGKNIKVCEFWEAVSEAMQRRGLAFDVSSFNTKYKYTHPYFLFQLRHGSSRNALIDAIRDQIVYALPMERSRLKAFANHIEAFAKSILEVDGNQVFVDSSKTKMILRALPQFGSMDVRAIHLVRRVEGVVASQLRRTGGDAEKEAHD